MNLKGWYSVTKDRNMKTTLFFFLLSYIGLAHGNCVDLSGTYALKKNSCSQMNQGVSLPMNAGLIKLTENETVTVVQKDCTKLQFINEKWKYSLNLKKQQAMKVMQSNYGYVVNEFIEKFNFCKKMKSQCKKFTKDNKWLLEVTAEGNLFIQNDLIVKRYNDLKKIELEQHSRCELEKIK